jgi:glycerol-3-phosphate O-acyltransferase
MRDVIELLRLQDVRLTPALERDRGDFREAINFLLRSELVRTMQDPRGEILYFEEPQRRALDFYRNSILHYLVAPSFLARALLRGTVPEALRDELGHWLDLFYEEFFVPRGEILVAHADGFIDYFERAGAIVRRDGLLVASEKGAPLLRFLAEQTRGYLEAYAAVMRAVEATDEIVPGKKIAREISGEFQRAMLLGEAERREAAITITFDNALALLVKRRILERGKSEGGRDSRDALYARGAAFGELRALRERLASALDAG